MHYTIIGKNHGETCESPAQCRVEAASCTGICGCDADRYLAGDACVLCKPLFDLLEIHL